MPHLHYAIVRLYDTVFDRAPDPEGLAFWNDAAERGYDLHHMAGRFVAAQEFADTYSQLTNYSFVYAMYVNVLDRAPEWEGAIFWTDALESGRADRARIVVEFSESREHVMQMSREQGVNLFLGSAGADTIAGTPGNDRIVGVSYDMMAPGNPPGMVIPELAKADGPDDLRGGAGADTIDGGGGNDTLLGGDGPDTFVFQRWGGVDVIPDFNRDDTVMFQGVTKGDVSWSLGEPDLFQRPTIRMSYANYDPDGSGVVDFNGLTYFDIPWVMDTFVFA